MTSKKNWTLNHKKATNWLKDNFPKAFGRCVPLKIGIFDDIKCFESEDKPALIWCRRAIRSQTQKTSYLKAIIKGDDRIDLNGEVAGTITEQQKEHAQSLLDERNNSTHKSKIRHEPEKSNNEATANADTLISRPVLKLKKKSSDERVKSSSTK